MIVAGFGFRGRATVDSLHDAYARAGTGADRLATAADKAGTPVFRAFAARLGLPVSAIAPGALAVAETQTRSPASQASRGTGSVAEASALAAAGPDARLTGPRVISTDRLATCALAKGENT